MTGLNEILNGSPEPAPSPVPEPAREERPREPTGAPLTDFPRRDADPAEEPREPAAPPAAEQEPDHVPISALKDERRKRQQAEQELQKRMAAYEAQMQQFQQPAPPRPDLFEDPDGALEHMQQQFQRQLVRTRLDMSVAMAKTQHTDYADAEAAFVEAVKANPSLYDQMLQDPHPAGFAYRVGKQVEALREIGGDPHAYREKVRKEIEADLRRQWETDQPAASIPQRSSIPPSLANARDTNGRFRPAWNGPTPLKDILAPRK